MAKEQFIDYYDLLCISAKANAELVETAVRAQLRRYSPQNNQTADTEKFELVKKAYLTLSNPRSRISYDAEHKRRTEGLRSGSHGSVTPDAMRDEIRKRHSVLTVLYERILKKPQDASLTGKEISAGVGLDFQSLEFPLWFLREKGLIGRTDVGDLRITAKGVEWLENAFGVGPASESSAAETGASETGDSENAEAEGMLDADAAMSASLLSASEVVVNQ